MSNNYFQDVPSRTKINDLTSEPIMVDGVRYNFTDYIENENVSDFPTYSQRVRNIAKNTAQTIDNYLIEIDNKLKLMENYIKGNISTFIGDKQTEIISKLNDIDGRINQFDDLINGAEATETTVGLINKNTIKEIINEFVTDRRIKEQSLNKMQEFGIGTSGISNTNLNDFLPNGLYTTSTNGLSSLTLNSQYNSKWGVQLNLTQENLPKAKIRARNNNIWTDWFELAQKQDLNLLEKAYLGNNELKTLNGRTAVSVVKGDILEYITNNKKYYYKVKKNGSLTIPNDEMTEKIMLGSDMGLEELKRKLTIGVI